MKFSTQHELVAPVKRLVSAMCLTALASGVSADVIYTYTGPKFDNFEYVSGDPPYAGNFFTTDDFVTVQIRLSDRIPAFSSLNFTETMEPIFNHTSGISPITPLSWEIGTGPLNFAGPPSPSSGMRFWAYLRTDADGNLAYWDIRYDQYLPNTRSPGTLYEGGDSNIRTYYDSYDGLSADWGISCLGDVACLAAFGYPMGRFEAWDFAGPAPMERWTISTVPVPAAAWLFGSSLAGLGLLRRKKNASA